MKFTILKNVLKKVKEIGVSSVIFYIYFYILLDTNLRRYVMYKP